MPEPPRRAPPRFTRPTGAGASIVLGAGVALLGALVAQAAPLVGLVWFFGGIGLIVATIRRATFGVASAALAASFHAIGRGALAEAEAILDQIEGSRMAWVRRISELQRAVIALRRGDVAIARDRLDAAIAQPIGFFAQANSAYQIEAALALRAFARASLGDHDGARGDIAAVRERPGASAESLARVSLAEAVILDRTGERDALRALLDRDKGLLLESCHPRERAIVRAYQRMLKVATSSVYRRGAPREAADLADEPPLVDWVAKVAPAAAPFVRVPRAVHLEGPPVTALRPATAEARDAVERSREAAAKATLRPNTLPRLLLAGGAMGLMLFSLVVVLSQPGKNNSMTWDWLPIPLIAIGVAGSAVIASGGVVGAAQVARRFRRAPRAALARLDEARAAIGRGDLDAAAAILRELAASDHDLVAVQSRCLEAAVAERRGDAAAMLAACDAGLARLAGVRAAIAGPLRPELIAQRAFALALLDRFDEASAELGSLARLPYAMLGRDHFRIRLIELARSGDIDAGARWVEQGAADLPLGVRDELLADLVRAVAAPGSAGLGEIERLKDELRTSPENRRWIDLVAPDLIARFTGAVEGGDPVRIASPDDEASPDEEASAERDRLAEIEAEGAEREGSRRRVL